VNHARTLVLSIGITCFGLAWLQASQEIVLGSRVYQPTGGPEARVFGRAAQDVYPDDVRAEPQRYVKMLVAWPGILRSYELTKDDETATIKLVLEHRYFDWIEDFSPRRERYFLSPVARAHFGRRGQCPEPLLTRCRRDFTRATCYSCMGIRPKYGTGPSV